MTNYIDIAASELDGFIYRIVRVPRLLELFNKKQNVLVRPNKWDDPFENFILRSQQVYGQCWTRQRASDAMWRIYSRDSKAVRIRSTVRRLAESLHQTRGKWANFEVFIGRVQYLQKRKLMVFALNVVQKTTASPAAMLAKTLLVKRPAFKHEREIRLLFVPHGRDASKQKFRYHIDPDVLIDQIMLDPRMHVQEADALKQRIKATTGFRGEIKRSLLYAPPPDFLRNKF
jgi:hypothetical protein